MDERDLPKLIHRVPNVLIACGSFVQLELCFSIMMRLPGITWCSPRKKIEYGPTAVWFKLMNRENQYWQLHGLAFQQVIIVGQIYPQAAEMLPSVVRPSQGKYDDAVYEIVRIP